jgi:N-methylhydantoinase A
VVATRARLRDSADLLALLDAFSADYGRRYGEGSQAPEAGIRLNTVRVASYAPGPAPTLAEVLPDARETRAAPPPLLWRDCHFVGEPAPRATAFFELGALAFGTCIEGPAVVLAPTTTYLVEPRWRLRIGRHGSGLFERLADAH